MEIIAAFLTGIVGPALYLVINKVIIKRSLKAKCKVREAIVDTTIINNELDQIRDEFEGDRVWISQFHNGGNFYPTGKSIQKFSIFYEVMSNGVSSVAHTFSNIPCSLYPKTFEVLMDGKGIFINDYKDPSIATYGLKQAAEAVGTKSSFMIPLFTLDDKFMGTIGLDYLGKKRKLTKDEWEHFQIKAGRIAGYLSSYLDK